MRVFKLAVVVTMLAAACLGQSASQQPVRMDQVVDRVVQQEQAFMDSLSNYNPLVETYIQEMRSDKELGLVPERDQYFLSKADFSNGIRDRVFIGEGAGKHSRLGKLSGMFSSPMAMKYVDAGFLQGIILDTGGFDRQNYKFDFLRREFLGDVRTIVFDVTPKKGSGQGRFLGRIWVEDQDYHVVRFSGVRVNAPRFHYYFHFDSWRINMGPRGEWLPTYVYTEEADQEFGVFQHAHMKAQTRIWGYNLKNPNRQDELTSVLVDAPEIKDQSEQMQDRGPLDALHAFQRQSEDNVLDRMERAGLLAPRGDVEKVLETVATNILVTNGIDLQPEVRCRILLTAPLESFNMAHTIVVSRGLIDTLPDEASLAMILAHELGHITLAHTVDTRWAFSDRVIFSDEEAFRRLSFQRDPSEEQAADQKAIELLQKSPYANKLNEGGLFLRMLASRSKDLPHLVAPHLGNRLALGNQVVRLQQVEASAPALNLQQPDQIAALPLGARLKVDPWTGRVEMMKNKPVAATAAREKMPFEVTPFMPYLTRRPSGNAPASSGNTAQAAPSTTGAAPAAETH
jgi:hypothetical protein